PPPPRMWASRSPFKYLASAAKDTGLKPFTRNRLYSYVAAPHFWRDSGCAGCAALPPIPVTAVGSNSAPRGAQRAIRWEL
ncbi:MAG TPA: hypothetical protein VIC26_16980, partial [Marinagarivorans sp.]